MCKIYYLLYPLGVSSISVRLISCGYSNIPFFFVPGNFYASNPIFIRKSSINWLKKQQQKYLNPKFHLRILGLLRILAWRYIILYGFVILCCKIIYSWFVFFLFWKPVTMTWPIFVQPVQLLFQHFITFYVILILTCKWIYVEAWISQGALIKFTAWKEFVWYIFWNLIRKISFFQLLLSGVGLGWIPTNQVFILW